MKTESDLSGIIEALRAEGIGTVRGIGAALNIRGIATPQGKQWPSTSVHRLLKRMERFA
jgi:hypothetical protein